MQPGSSTLVFCNSLWIGKEEFMHHPCQLGSPSHFLTLSLGPQASLPLVTHKTLLQGPLAFCLHPCIIHHVT